PVGRGEGWGQVNVVELFCAGLLPLIPPWLVYFSQVPITNDTLTLEAALQPWPILATTVAIFLTGLFARVFPDRLAPGYWRWRNALGSLSPSDGERARERGSLAHFRLFDLTLSWFQTSGTRIHLAALVLTLVICFTTQLAHYGAAFSGREVALLILL